MDQPSARAKECDRNSTTLHSKFMTQGVAKSLTHSECAPKPVRAENRRQTRREAALAEIKSMI
jgi:hypothetical protein